jgi:TonB family protein
MVAPILMCGCAAQPAKMTQGTPAMDVQPVQVTTTYIAAHVPHYARGQYAIVEICISADGTIDSTRVTQSSTDKAFDSAAMTWARQARYRPQMEDGRPVYGCQEVRVEINRTPGSHMGREGDSALG